MAGKKAKKKTSSRRPASSPRKAKAAMARKSRANWKRSFELDAGLSPIRRLAQFAVKTAKPAERAALCTYGKFNDTLDALLEAETQGDLEDLNDAERAFCEGWAFLAGRQCRKANSSDIDDALLVKWIQDQMQPDPSKKIMTG